MCELTLFGAPQLVCDDRSRRITRRKARALLAYLAVTQQVQTRETLVALLWPDDDESTGRADLSRILSTLRKALGARTFESDRDGVALDQGAGLWVDVVHFRQLVQRCREKARAGAVEECRGQLAKAAQLYRDEFLAGFTLPGCAAFDEWQRVQAESLRHDLDWVLDRLVETHAADDDLRPAIAYARRRVNLDPLHEAAQRRLISLLARNGQRAEARRQYERCAQLLEEELGVEPHPDTRSLYEQVLHVRESRAPLPAFLAEAAKESDEPQRFVAREAQLAMLHEHLDAAMNGDGRVVFVTGGAGRGKTSLLHAFARRAQERYAQLLVAGGNGTALAGAGDPYLPFREALDMLCGNAGGLFSVEQARRLWSFLPQTAQAIVAHGPQLLDVFVPAKQLLSRAESAASTGEPWLVALRAEVDQVQLRQDLRQTALFSQFSNVLQALARQQPLLLLLDDLQWLDDASTGLLFHLGRRLSGSRILVVGAYRPDELPQPAGGQSLSRVLNELRRAYGDVFLDLAQADRQAGRRFIDAYLDGEPNRLDEAFRQGLYEQTEGHPLFTVELLRDMQRRGDLYQDAEGQWCASRALRWQHMPARVEAVIAQRIEPLDDDAREILSIASVEGEQFTAECVARVSGMDEDALLRVLSDALGKRQRLVWAQGEIVAGGKPLSLYRFSHGLFQQYLYQQLDPGRQRRLHGAVAAALATLYAEDLDAIVVRLAHHYDAADHWHDVAHYRERAGDVARRGAALPEAVRHYQAALAYWPASEALARARVWHKLGRCQWMLARHDEALASLQTALDLFQAQGAGEGAGATLVTLGRVYWEQGAAREAQHAYRRALTLLEDEPQSVALGWALAGMAGYHMHVSDYDLAIKQGERALALANRVGDEALIIQCLCDLGSARSGKGDWEGLALEQESLARALALNRAHDAGRAYVYLAEGLGYRGRYGEARQILQEALAYAQRLTLPYIGAAVERHLVDVDWLTGRWSAALARLGLWGQGESDLVGLYRNLTLARVYNDLGQPETARELVKEVLAGAGNTLDPRVALLGELARAEAARGDPAAAVDAMREILEATDQTHYLYVNVNMALLTICYAPPVYDAGAATAGARTALKQLRRLDAQYGTQNIAACLQEGQGWLALIDGDGAGAAASLGKAAGLWQALGHPYDEARALHGLTLALTQAGNRDGAVTACRRARALLDDLARQLQGDAASAASFLNSALVSAIRGACSFAAG